MGIMITKSDYVNYIMCPNLYYLENLDIKRTLKEPLNDLNKSIIENGIKIGEYARNYFGQFYLIDRNTKDLNKSYQDTLNAIQNKNTIICEASFIYKDLFCAIDILKVNDNGTFDIYEVKSSKPDKNGKIKDVYNDDVSFQYYVLTSLGYKINKVYIMTPNRNYRFHKSLDIHKYFQLTEALLKDDVEDNLNNIRKINSEIKGEAKTICKSCPYFKHCYAHLKENNIFEIAGNINQADKYNNGIQTFQDLLNNKSKFKVNSSLDNAIQQAEFELYDKPLYIDKKHMTKFLNDLVYPLYYLDFEGIKDVFPFIEGEEIEFERVIQYSLHIKRTPTSPLEHKEYLYDKKGNNLEDVADSLIKDLKNSGSIIVYNHYENDRFNGLIRLLPHKEKELTAIKNRLLDMMIPFQQRKVYCKEMKGQYTIKKVLPALCKDYKDAYANLPLVHNGGQIESNYEKLINSTGKEHDFIKKSMLLYCEQDTLSEVYIIEKLYELVK